MFADHIFMMFSFPEKWTGLNTRLTLEQCGVSSAHPTPAQLQIHIQLLTDQKLNYQQPTVHWKPYP